MKIFDMSCVGTRNDEKRGKGKKEKTPKILVNRSVKRIAFNTCAFETLGLIDKGVRFELEDDGTWYVAPDTSDRGIILHAHRGVFYFQSMILIRSMMPDSKQYTATYILVKEGSRWRLDDAVKISQNPTRDVRANNPDDIKMQKKINQAEKMLKQYNQTDFPGRIKTYQIIASERLLATSR